MSAIELLKEIDAWLSFNQRPSKEELLKMRKSIQKHIKELEGKPSCADCKYFCAEAATPLSPTHMFWCSKGKWEGGGFPDVRNVVDCMDFEPQKKSKHHE